MPPAKGGLGGPLGPQALPLFARGARRRIGGRSRPSTAEWASGFGGVYRFFAEGLAQPNLPSAVVDAYAPNSWTLSSASMPLSLSCRGGAIIRARRATSRTFIVRLPWSACYCGRLRWALQRLGLATMNDPFEDGSDNAAFFVATGSRTLAGRTMIRAYGAELEASASFDDGEARLAAIARVGVHEIIHDWKWLDCEADVSKLRQLGVRVQQLAETTDRGGQAVLKFRVARSGQQRRRCSPG